MNRSKQEATLRLLLYYVMDKYYPNTLITYEASFSHGMYFKSNQPLKVKDCEFIKAKMQEEITNKTIINKVVMKRDEAIKYYKQKQLEKSAQIIEQSSIEELSFYEINGYKEYFLNPLLDSCESITNFYLELYDQGIYMSLDKQVVKQHRLYHTFKKFQNWGEKVEVCYISQLNEAIKNKRLVDLIMMSETLFEIQLFELAKDIAARKKVKCIMIAGPSSAGKTTFSKRLSNYLMIMGMKPIAIAMDDFYKEQEEIPMMSDGSYDYECYESIDDELFNKCIKALINQEEVYMPKYQFGISTKVFDSKPLKLEDNQVLIIEGIHGLNPKATRAIEDDRKYRIYINAMTHMNITEHERVKTSDIRMIRRMYRDYQFRDAPLAETIGMWPNVTKGEEENIYPYQEEVDAMINTSMIYELALLKEKLYPLIQELEPTYHENEYIQRLEALLSLVCDGDSSILPTTSILAEFIGNSIYNK